MRWGHWCCSNEEEVLQGSSKGIWKYLQMCQLMQPTTLTSSNGCERKLLGAVSWSTTRVKSATPRTVTRDVFREPSSFSHYGGNP